MIKINQSLTPQMLLPKLEQLFELAGQKIQAIEKNWGVAHGRAPVHTIAGKYKARGWTEWTQGFQFGSAILQYDATGDEIFLKYGRDQTIEQMAPHISHTGVHDHGFNNVSTYGNLLRLMREGRIRQDPREQQFYELALKISGAVQAARWTTLPKGLGYIYSFNGPQSLFCDTIRSLRALALSHQFGHYLLGEQEEKINLLERVLQHAETTAQYNVYYGKKRDAYDISGRVAHESLFNVNSGSYRCPSTQQGYSPFSTWTRGHAWILSGFSELLEFLETLPETEFEKIATELFEGKNAVLQRFLMVAETVADFYLEQTPLDGIPYWDTGAPGLAQMGDYLNRLSDPFNDHEPVDSSAAAISAQGLIRLGKYLSEQGKTEKGKKYFQAGLTVAEHLFAEPYLSFNPNHEGLLLHSIYHRPNNWDYIPTGAKIPSGESSMWGDYHAMELGILLWRMAKEQPYYKFYQ